MDDKLNDNRFFIVSVIQFGKFTSFSASTRDMYLNRQDLVAQLGDEDLVVLNINEVSEKDYKDFIHED
jgi:hypothetical protein